MASFEETHIFGAHASAMLNSAHSALQGRPRRLRQGASRDREVSPPHRSSAPDTGEIASV